MATRRQAVLADQAHRDQAPGGDTVYLIERRGRTLPGRGGVRTDLRLALPGLPMSASWSGG